MELEAQVNRQGENRSLGPSPRQMADDIWNRLIAAGQLRPRRLPEEFGGESLQIRPLHLPSGPLSIEHPTLFEGRRFTANVRGQQLTFENEEQLAYASLLAHLGINGNLRIPIRPVQCQRISEALRNYSAEFRRLFGESIAEITSDHDLQRRILKEGWKRAIVLE